MLLTVTLVFCIVAVATAENTERAKKLRERVANAKCTHAKDVAGTVFDAVKRRCRHPRRVEKSDDRLPLPVDKADDETAPEREVNREKQEEKKENTRISELRAKYAAEAEKKKEAARKAAEEAAATRKTDVEAKQRLIAACAEKADDEREKGECAKVGAYLELKTVRDSATSADKTALERLANLIRQYTAQAENADGSRKDAYAARIKALTEQYAALKRKIVGNMDNTTPTKPDTMTVDRCAAVCKRDENACKRCQCYAKCGGNRECVSSRCTTTTRPVEPTPKTCEERCKANSADEAAAATCIRRNCGDSEQPTCEERCKTNFKDEAAAATCIRRCNGNTDPQPAPTCESRCENAATPERKTLCLKACANVNVDPVPQPAVSCEDRCKKAFPNNEDSAARCVQNQCSGNNDGGNADPTDLTQVAQCVKTCVANGASATECRRKCSRKRQERPERTNTDEIERQVREIREKARENGVTELKQIANGRETPKVDPTVDVKVRTAIEDCDFKAAECKSAEERDATVRNSCRIEQRSICDKAKSADQAAREAFVAKLKAEAQAKLEANRKAILQKALEAREKKVEPAKQCVLKIRERVQNALADLRKQISTGCRQRATSLSACVAKAIREDEKADKAAAFKKCREAHKDARECVLKYIAKRKALLKKAREAVKENCDKDIKVVRKCRKVKREVCHRVPATTDACVDSDEAATRSCSARVLKAVSEKVRDAARQQKVLAGVRSCGKADEEDAEEKPMDGKRQDATDKDLVASGERKINVDGNKRCRVIKCCHSFSDEATEALDAGRKRGDADLFEDEEDVGVFEVEVSGDAEVEEPIVDEDAADLEFVGQAFGEPEQDEDAPPVVDEDVASAANIITSMAVVMVAVASFF